MFIFMPKQALALSKLPPQTQAHFRTIGVTERDIVEVAALVDAPELMEQRQGFRADDYSGGKTRRKSGLGARAFR